MRQALAWGINRQEVVDKGFDGLGRPLDGTALIPPYWAGSDKKIYSTDYDKAKQLLADAGFPNGFKLELLASPEAFYMIPIAEVSQAEWRKIGREYRPGAKRFTSTTAVISAMATKGRAPWLHRQCRESLRPSIRTRHSRRSFEHRQISCPPIHAAY